MHYARSLRVVSFIGESSLLLVGGGLLVLLRPALARSVFSLLLETLEQIHSLIGSVELKLGSALVVGESLLASPLLLPTKPSQSADQGL